MFTGIVSAIGEVREVDRGRGGRSARLAIAAPGVTAELGVGGSVAVNGCCLTAVSVAGSVFRAETVPETLARTTLGALQPGGRVNLEFPLALGGRLDGHLLQGHVDGTARVLAVEEVELGREVTITLPPDLTRFVAEKGSIGIDGISLTVARLEDGGLACRVAMIPRTLAVTIAGGYAAGSLVNLEVDVIARYAERLLGAGKRGI
ncbi:MAG: riboflavin synthase [Candidatus Dormibacteraceae bacterium]